jgi:pimeloyl-ACP methyl ester carboxylesterase
MNVRMSLIAIASTVLAGVAAAQSIAPTPSAVSRAVATAAPKLERLVVKADDGESLVVWAKHPTGHVVGSILLLHGRTWSALPNFDLHVAGESRSTMDALAAGGYAVYALDQRGYGATARDTSGWLTPDRAARDAGEVLDWIATRETRSGAAHGERPALLGYSRGTLTALLAAQQYPKKLSSLIVYGLIYDSRTRGTHTADPGVPPRKHTTATAAGEDFITPDAAPPSVKDAYVRASLLRDTVRVDWKSENEFDVLDPHAIHMPVLVLNGERDPYVHDSEAPAFFAQLASIDRTWVVLSNSDHVAHLERPRDFVHAITSFLGRVREK